MEPPKPPPPNLEDVDLKDYIAIGGPVDRACVSLRLFGDALVPDDVTHRLGCQPTEARHKGDVIPSKQYHRPASTGSWRLEGSLPGTAEIDEQVEALLLTVTSDLSVWKNLSTEFEVDIFCGVFLNESNRGFCLSPRVMQLMSERGIVIGFDIYC
jgi:hypothetical protein